MKCPLKPMPSDKYFSTSQLKAGIKFELEHTTSKKVAKQIVKAHLMESPLYYKELAKLEKKLSRK